MIISASRRTDIPCYYSRWMRRRLEEGFVLVRNPMRPSQLRRVTLSSDIVDCIVFWTKDAQNILDTLPLLDQMGYRYYFQFTITPYDQQLEPYLRTKPEILDTFTELSRRIGRHRVVWRYDPIICTDQLTADWHKRQFAQMCGRLAPFTEQVVISFVDLYTRLRGSGIRSVLPEEITQLAAFIGQTAGQYGVQASACCEQMDLSGYGITPANCIDAARISRVCDAPVCLKRDNNQRVGCGCVKSVDIGVYNSCGNGCVYCYANRGTAVRNLAAHDPDSPILNGRVLEGETIVPMDASSNRQLQQTWF